MQLGGSGRILSDNLGNEGVSKPPLRPPTGAVRQGTGPQAAQLPGPPMGFNANSAGIYLPIQKAPFVLAAATVQMLLLEPDKLRVYLMIRNASTSLGILAVGFNNDPNTVEAADMELAPGTGFLWDFFVPQNRIIARAIGGQCNVMLNYSNKDI